MTEYRRCEECGCYDFESIMHWLGSGWYCEYCYAEVRSEAERDEAQVERDDHLEELKDDYN